MSKVNKSELLSSLRNESGAGIMDCKKVLEKYKWNFIRAKGYLKYKGCAINIKKGYYEEWLNAMVEKYYDEHTIKELSNE